MYNIILKHNVIYSKHWAHSSVKYLPQPCQKHFSVSIVRLQSLRDLEHIRIHELWWPNISTDEQHWLAPLHGRDTRSAKFMCAHLLRVSVTLELNLWPSVSPQPIDMKHRVLTYMKMRKQTTSAVLKSGYQYTLGFHMHWTNISELWATFWIPTAKGWTM